MFRIVAEAVRNAAHHGGARHVRVELAGSPLHVRVIDDGCGFHTGSSSGLGVAGYGPTWSKRSAIPVAASLWSACRSSTAPTW